MTRYAPAREAAVQEIIAQYVAECAADVDYVAPPRATPEPAWYCERTCPDVEPWIDPDRGAAGQGAWCCGHCRKPIKGAYIEPDPAEVERRGLTAVQAELTAPSVRSAPNTVADLLF